REGRSGLIKECSTSLSLSLSHSPSLFFSPPPLLSLCVSLHLSPYLYLFSLYSLSRLPSLPHFAPLSSPPPAFRFSPSPPLSLCLPPSLSLSVPLLSLLSLWPSLSP